MVGSEIHLQYGKEMLLTYTQLNGQECAEVVQCHWLKSLTRISKKKIVFKKSFPFVGLDTIDFTDVLLNVRSDVWPLWKHIYALESPRAIAKKFGISYPSTSVELVENDLEYV